MTPNKPFHQTQSYLCWLFMNLVNLHQQTAQRTVYKTFNNINKWIQNAKTLLKCEMKYESILSATQRSDRSHFRSANANFHKQRIWNVFTLSRQHRFWVSREIFQKCQRNRNLNISFTCCHKLIGNRRRRKRSRSFIYERGKSAFGSQLFFFCPFNDSDVERNFPPKQDKLSNIAFKHNTFHDDRESLAGELCLKVDPVACKCQTQDELLRLLFSRLERAESVVIWILPRLVNWTRWGDATAAETSFFSVYFRVSIRKAILIMGLSVWCEAHYNLFFDHKRSDGKIKQSLMRCLHRHVFCMSRFAC